MMQTEQKELEKLKHWSTEMQLVTSLQLLRKMKRTMPDYVIANYFRDPRPIFPMY